MTQFTKVIKTVMIFLSLCCLFGLTEVAMAQNKNKLESWYTYWGIGYANPAYPDELDNILNDLEQVPGVSHVSIGLDVLGFYWPLNKQLILGGIVNAFGDRYEQDGSKLQINGYSFSASVMHFVGDTIGRGFFLRGDLGPTRFVVDTSFAGAEASDWGFGLLIGGGYGFNISRGTRLLVNANFSSRRVAGENTSTVGITLGGLF